MSQQRKSMANVVQFLDLLDLDCMSNQEALIARAKETSPFKNVDWCASQWDITAAVAHKVRGHESRKTKRLNFVRNPPNGALPLGGRFAELVKAMTVLRFITGGQGAPNQQRFIDGWRYIFDVTQHKNHLIELVTTEDLVSACRLAGERLSSSTAYNVHKSIHEISDLLDKNKLVKVHLGFRYHGLKRPANVSGAGYKRLDDPGGLEPVGDKVVGGKVLKALGLLYQQIPSEAFSDRVRILLVTLALFLGRRIGEILTLPAERVRRNERGTAYVTYYPQKRAQGDLIVVKERIPLPTAIVELVEGVVDELLELTQEVREVATYIHEHQHADCRALEPYEKQGWIGSAELSDILGMSAHTWTNRRKLPSQPHPDSSNRVCWMVNRVKKAMEKELDLKPVVISGQGNLHLKDCLAIHFLNACQSKKQTFKYAVRSFNWQHLSDFLGSNSSRRVATKSVFDRYLKGDEVEALSTNSHAFRHTLNTWLDEGGMSDAAQTKWFGRKSPADTRAYQHTSPMLAALQVHQDLKEGKIGGPVAEQLAYIPIDIKDAFLKARVRAVHDVGPGVCFHDFSQTPCERSLQCSANCKDYHWRRDDIGRIDDLKRQYVVTGLARSNALARAEAGRGKSRDWLAHIDKKLETLKKQMAEQCVEEFDPQTYIDDISKESEG